mgnify:CR=1 FL=1
MAAAVSLADEHTDTLHSITLITGAALETGLTPEQCQMLHDKNQLAEAEGNEIAAMYRVAGALMRVGRTEHTLALTKSVMRIAS